MMRAMVFQVTNTLPPAVTLTAVKAANNLYVNLTWTGNAYGVLTSPGNMANAIGFNIMRAPVALGGIVGTYVQIGTALASAVSYIDTTTAGTGWWSYEVVAYNAAGSTPSNAAQVTFATAPYAPTPFTVTIYSGRQVNIAWGVNPLTTGFNAPTGFRIYRSTTLGTPKVWTLLTTINNPATVAWSDTTVAINQPYWYYMVAFNPNGTSAPTATLSVTTPGAPPSAPYALNVSNVTSTAATLTWLASLNNVANFVIERADGWPNQNNPFVQVGSVTSAFLTFTDTTLANNQTYTYRVRATGPNGPSPYSGTATAITGPNTPAAPSNLASGAVTTNTIAITWTDNSLNELSFAIYVSSNGGLTWQRFNATYNATSFVISGLVTKITYTIRIAGVNAMGQGAFSNVITATTL
jgi:hypothetical protein